MYGVKNYTKSIGALKQFATQNGYTYVDHWGHGLMQQRKKFYRTYKKNSVSQALKGMKFGHNM